jgi:Outer membrane protein beta-barrel domain
MKHILPLCAALALASLSAPAFADDSAIFVRAELGNSTTRLGDLENLEDDYVDTDFSYNLHAGYFFNGNLGAEAFYGNYGEGTDLGVSRCLWCRRHRQNQFRRPSPPRFLPQRPRRYRKS